MTPFLVVSAHALDVLTLLVVAQHGIAGEANPLARYLFTAAGPAGLVAFKTAGVGLLLAVIGTSKLRLALATLAGLAGAVVNVLAWRVIG